MFKFVPMNQQYAEEMIQNWQYGEFYRLYDYKNEAECLLDVNNWGKTRFAVLDKNSDLIGELTTEFYRVVDKNDEDDGYVEFDAVKNIPQELLELWVGFGLKPELTGQGLGETFVRACVKFAISFHQYKGTEVKLGVAAFNQRAVKTYQKAGFEIFDQIQAEINGEQMDILWMKLRGSDDISR